MQWCVLQEDQPVEHRALVQDWCDDYGVPEETAEVLQPSVRTQAQPAATAGDNIRDTAFIEGPIPHQSSVEFTAFLKPEVGQPKFDSDWKQVVGGAVWSQQEIEEMGDDWCRAQPVATTERVDVHEEGLVHSPAVKTQSTGTIYWVEKLFAVDPITSEEELIHEGECGLVNESTVIYPLPKAKPAMLAATGEPMKTGLISGAIGTAIAGTIIVLLRAKRVRN